MLRPTPLYRDGLFKLPLFARAGAIISMAHVDEQTLCSEGRRKDGSVRNELVAKVFDFGPGANSPPRPSGVYKVTFNEADPGRPGFDRIGDAACASTSRFICENGDTTFGTSVYMVGNMEELGSWDPNRAVLLKPDGPYPRWTGFVDRLPDATPVEWKCIKRLEGGDRRVVQWEPGANNVVDRNKSTQVGVF